MSVDHDELIERMTAAVPAGMPQLDPAQRDTLRGLTGALLSTEDDREYHRYRSIIGRDLGREAVHAAARSRYGGRRILVTGGTGCIGSTLLRQLRELGPAELISVSLPADGLLDPVPGVRYLEADLKDRSHTRRVFRQVAPDIVFHCAAQRSPWLAERKVARTLLSNVIGTDNVLQGARDVDVELFVHASTGKAMRYATGDIYAGTKKLAEWLVHDYAREGRTVGLGRFTHVVDNAVVVQKIDESTQGPDGVMRVHDPDMYFYAQSAAESAQLLLLAGLHQEPDLRALAIRDLGAPIGLLHLVLGRLRDRCGGRDPVVYFSGYDEGYEHSNPPGLYDPATAMELSPLINGVEAATARCLDGFPGVDEFRIRLPQHGQASAAVVSQLRALCQRRNEHDIRAGLLRAVAQQADAFFHQCPEPLFTRLGVMAAHGSSALPTTRVPARAA